MNDNLPLESIRVVNFGWVWAGPVCGQTLSFMGAEVYKVESRARVDLTRNLPPFAEGVASPDRSLSNHACWAGNGSISLDLTKDKAKKLAMDLIAQSDIVIENFGHGVMERMGFGYDELRKTKEDIILLSLPAAGISGPLKKVRTYGLSLTALTGLDSLVGYKDEGPIPVENAYSDPFVGVFSAFSAITALQHRDNSGKGQHIEFSQQEAIMQMVGPAYMDYVMNGRVGGTKGNEHPLGIGSPHGVFPCAGEDRWISIAVMNDREWIGLIKAMGKPDWAFDKIYAGPAKRVENIDELHRKMSAWTKDHDDRKLAGILQSFGVAAAPVLNVADLLTDPQYKARGTYIEVLHPLGFNETIYGSYVKTSGYDAKIEPGPSIGQSNKKVFKDILGMSDEDYDQMIQEKVIY